MRNTKLKAILIAGLAAGTLDICAAFIVYVHILAVAMPQKILQSIAAGIYGKESYAGGSHTAAIGLALHFIIAFFFAAIFVFLYPSIKKLISNALISGIIYGCFVWFMMNYVVMPLSAIGHPPKFDWEFTSIALAIIIICVGIPVSLITAKVFRATNKTNEEIEHG